MKIDHGHRFRFRYLALPPATGYQNKGQGGHCRFGGALVFAVSAAFFAASLLGGPSFAQSTGPATTETEPPAECVKASHVGQVTFPHQMHVDAFEIDCVTCHHEVNAKKLSTPHDSYIENTCVRCSECHHDQDQPIPAQACSACHVASNDTSDQSLSAKVVIHKSCSECHEIGTGAEASASCQFCHSGPKLAW